MEYNDGADAGVAVVGISRDRIRHTWQQHDCYSPFFLISPSFVEKAPFSFFEPRWNILTFVYPFFNTTNLTERNCFTNIFSIFILRFQANNIYGFFQKIIFRILKYWKPSFTPIKAIFLVTFRLKHLVFNRVFTLSTWKYRFWASSQNHFSVICRSFKFRFLPNFFFLRNGVKRVFVEWNAAKNFFTPFRLHTQLNKP